MIAPESEIDSQRVVIAHFSSLNDNRPVREELSWGELRTRLMKFEIRDSKAGSLWSPVSYTPNTTRGNSNVETVYAAVMDVDQAVEPTYIVQKLAGTFEFVIHSTFSSTPEHPKFRVVALLGRPCPAAKWPAIWSRISDLLTGGHADPATSDPARAFFWPSARPDGKTFVYSGRGRPVVPGDLPPSRPSEQIGSAGVELDAGGRLPHGRHHEWLRSFTASLVSRTLGVSHAQVVEATRRAFGALSDDLAEHEQEIDGLARSALTKFGRPFGDETPSRRSVRDVLGDSP